MAHEERRITISGEELVTALTSFARVTPGFLPDGEITDCALDASGARLTCDGRNITLKAEDLLKPLIRFCIENNIMLPRNGRKSASVAEGKVMLNIELNLDIDLAGSHEPMRLGHPINPVNMPASPGRANISPADLAPQNLRPLR